MKRTACLAIVLSMGLGPAQARAAHAQKNTTRVFRWHASGKGFLGVQVTPLTPELRVHFGVPEDAGVLVSRVEDGGPAEAAGIGVGDILTAVDGAKVDSPRRLARLVRRKKEGDLVTVELYRDGGLESYPVTVGERAREVLDLAESFRFVPEMDDLSEHEIYLSSPELHLDEEAMKAFERAVEGLEEKFDSEEWQERLERLQELDFSAIQDRMEEVERKLKHLEKELDKEGREDSGRL